MHGFCMQTRNGPKNEINKELLENTHRETACRVASGRARLRRRRTSPSLVAMPSLVERISSSTGALMLCVVWLVLPWIPWGPSAPVHYNTCAHTPRVPGALLHPSKLLVAPSLEDGGGNGLFVTAAVPNRTVLSFYCGTLLTLTQVIRSEDTSYCMAFGPNKHVDAGPHPEVLARYANHAFDERAPQR